MNEYCHLVYEDDNVDCEFTACEHCAYYYADTEKEE